MKLEKPVGEKNARARDDDRARRICTTRAAARSPSVASTASTIARAERGGTRNALRSSNCSRWEGRPRGSGDSGGGA